MGLLDSLKSAVSSVVVGTKELFQGNVVTNVANRIVNKIEPIIGARSLTNDEKTIFGVTGAAAGALALAPIALTAPVASAGSAVAKAFGTGITNTISNHPFVSALVGVVGVPAAISAIKENPSVPINTVSSLANFGSNLGTLAASPSIANAKEVIKDNPILTAATAAGLTYVVGKGLLNTIATIENTSAVKKNTVATAESIQVPSSLPPQIIQVPQTVSSIAQPIGETVVSPAPASSLASGAKKTTKKKKKKKINKKAKSLKKKKTTTRRKRAKKRSKKKKKK